MIGEIIKETCLRKRFIPRLHVTYVVTYLAIYLVSYGMHLLTPDSSYSTQWGLWLFAWSGCLFPVLLTAGIFGNDIDSGRMLQLATMPVSLGWLYTLRVLGMFIQCLVHLAVCFSLIFVMQSLTGYATEKNLGSWFLASLLISLTWLTLSTTLSTFLMREYNVVVIMIGSIVIFMLLMMINTAAALADWSALSETATKIAKYGIPPVIMLFNLGMQKCSITGGIVAAIHAIGIALFYAIVGIVILNHMEFVHKRE